MEKKKERTRLGKKEEGIRMGKREEYKNTVL